MTLYKVGSLTNFQAPLVVACRKQHQSPAMTPAEQQWSQPEAISKILCGICVAFFVAVCGLVSQHFTTHGMHQLLFQVSRTNGYHARNGLGMRELEKWDAEQTEKQQFLG